MPSPEALYRSVSAKKVPGFVIDKIDEDTVSSPQTPFKDGFIPDFSQIVTSRRKSNKTPQLIQVSPDHHRSFEMRYGEEGFIFWADEYGNMYGTIRLKGGNVSNPDVHVLDHAPSGFLIMGLQDSDSILRTVRASNLMRANGIDTEAVIRITEPAQLQYEGELVSREEYKRRLIEKVWNDDKRRPRKKKRGWTWIPASGITPSRPATREDIPKLTKELNEMTFYFTTSALQVSERLLDLGHATSPENFEKMMGRVFTFVNARNKSQNRNGHVYHEFDSKNPDDMARYFTSYLPEQIARNYSKLHNLGLVHTWPHLGNVSLAGGIYDVDSVAGKPLGFGDEEQDERDRLDDVDFLISGKLEFQHGSGILSLLKVMEEAKMLPEGSEASKSFARAFVLKYMEGRGWLDNFKENIDNILFLFENCADIYLSREEERKYFEGKIGEEKTSFLTRSSVFRGYKHPTVVDTEILPIPEKKDVTGPDANGVITIHISPEDIPNKKKFEITLSEITDERRVECVELAKKMLTAHQDYITGLPRYGKSFFQFPKLPDEMLKVHKDLRKEDITDVIRLYINGSLDEVAKDFDVRAVGSFMLSVVQINYEGVADAINGSRPSRDDPALLDKLTRINDFFGLLPEGLGPWIRSYINDITDNWTGALNIEGEITKKSALRLFARGLITKDLSQIFNHNLMDIILNEFTEEHRQALAAALDEPKIVERLLGEEWTRHQLKTGLTGVQVRSGQVKDLALFPDIEEDIKEVNTAILQYLFSDVDKDSITDEQLEANLDSKIDKDWVAINLRHLLIAQKRVHPNSHMADSIRAADLEQNDLVELLKIALDISGGDLSKVDPTIMSILSSKQFKGTVETEDAAKLTMACIGFGIEYPDIIEPYLDENESKFVDFLSTKRSITFWRDGGIYRHSQPYPVKPIYSLMSQGFEVLPDKLKDFFIEQGNNADLVDSLAEGVLHHLFNYNGYFKNFFGTMLHVEDEDYPAPAFTPRDIYRIGSQNWRIVHEEIWDVLRQADPEVLRRFVRKEIPEKKVDMDFEDRVGGFVGHRETPLEECLPPDLYERVADIKPKKKPELEL